MDSRESTITQRMCQAEQVQTRRNISTLIRAGAGDVAVPKRF